MVTVPVLNMIGKSETLIETSPVVMENVNSVELPDSNGNSVKLGEEKMMICASNCEDNTFDDAASVPEEKPVMTCTNNYEDNAFHVEASPGVDDRVMPSKCSNEDVEVDIVEEGKRDEERVAEREPQDVTESSSSFGSTDSGIGNTTGSCDMEVESQARDGNSTELRFDGFSDLFKTRKKKLTSHWRRFIRPLMWRCKWVELQLRELQSQVSKYDKEIKECDLKKQCELEKCVTEDHGVKSAPFISQNRSVKLMRRKKRKRVEETVDLASYTSNHSLFSYYAGKRRFTDSAHMDDDHGMNDTNPSKKTPFGIDEYAVNGGWTTFELKDGDEFESILRKIDEAQLRVRQLKIRMDKVVIEHAGKFNSDGSSLAPNDASASCVPKLVFPNVNIEKAPFGSVCTTSQQAQVNPLPDMVESTGQPQNDVKCEKPGKDVLMHDRPVKEELDNGKEVGMQSPEKPLATHEGKAGNVQNVADPNPSNQVPVTQGQPTVKTRSISKLITPKNKRKRGRRKARSSRWSRKSSG